MKRFIGLILMLALFPLASFANLDQVGILQSFDLEAKTLQMNDNIYQLSDTLIVWDNMDNLMGRRALSVGQEVQITITESTSDVLYQGLVERIKILSILDGAGDMH